MPSWQLPAGGTSWLHNVNQGKLHSYHEYMHAFALGLSAMLVYRGWSYDTHTGTPNSTKVVQLDYPISLFSLKT